MPNFIVLDVILLNVVLMKCQHAELCSDECQCAECYYAESHSVDYNDGFAQSYFDECHSVEYHSA